MTQKCQIIRIAQKQKKMTDVSSKKIRNFRNIKHQVEENLKANWDMNRFYFRFDVKVGKIAMSIP